MRSYRRLMDRMIEKELRLTHIAIHQILTNELRMKKKIRAEIIPKKPFARLKGQEGKGALTFWNRLKIIPIS